MLNEAMNEVVLVKGWKKGARWSFPRGKINKDESDLDCAIREVYEETGYDIKEAGLADHPERVHSIEVSMREQHMQLFVFRGVPMDTYFEPRTRKEISKIDWYKLSELPTVKQMRAQQHGETDVQHQSGKFYMVAPFLGPLKQWIRSQKKKDKLGISAATVAAMPTDDEAVAEKAISDVEAVVSRSEVGQQSDGHFNNLLAGLRASNQPVDSPHSVSQPQTTTDPATALKQMLSIGQGGTPQVKSVVSPQLAAPASTNPLLDMLRGNSSAAAATLQRPQQLPATPFEQITGAPTQPQTPPHHNHVRPKQMPPPGQGPQPPLFPLGPQAQWQQQRPLPQEQPPQPPPIQQQWQPPKQLPPKQSEHTSQLLNLLRSNAREDSVHFKSTPTGFATPAQGQPAGQSQQHPMVPQASRLPPPKLNAHTMSLLSAFKSPEAKRAAPVQQLQHQLSELSASDISPTMPAPKPYQDGSQVPLKMEQKSNPQHQSALLNLFNTPSGGGGPPALAPPPVELAAQSSPHPPAQQLRSDHPKPYLGLETTALPRAPSASLTSATVTGPLHSPDVDMLKRNQPPPVELGENTPVVPPHMQRPSLDEALPQWPTPQASTIQALSPASNAPEVSNQIQAPKPVPYQILQRPGVLNHPVHAVATSSPSQFDRRQSIPTDQRNALLSLLTGPTAAAGQGLKPSHSGIMSPVSPLPGGSAKSVQGSPAGGDAKSRVSSIASLPGNVAGGVVAASMAAAAATTTTSSTGAGGHHHHQPPVSMIMTDFGMPMANVEKHAQMQQAPGVASVMNKAKQGDNTNSPVDKNVLLGFLQNVAKTG